MHYIRSPRAAVAAPHPADDRAELDRRTGHSIGPSTQVLWASRPLNTPAGRLVAVRLRGGDLHVALVTGGGLRWVQPEALMTAAQAERWTANSAFAPDHGSRRRHSSFLRYRRLITH